METNYISNTMKVELKEKISSFREESVRCFRMCLHCIGRPSTMDEKNLCTQSLLELSLQLFATSRVCEHEEQRQSLLLSAESFAQKAKEVDGCWLAFYVSGLVRRKLKTDPSLYLEDFSRASLCNSRKEKGHFFFCASCCRFCFINSQERCTNCMDCE